MLMEISDMGTEPALKDKAAYWNLESLPALLTSMRTHVWSLGGKRTLSEPDIPTSPCLLS